MLDPDRARDLAAQIAAAPAAWATADDLAGIEAAELAELAAAGWAVRWQLPLAEAWCLTPWAAEQLGLQTDEAWVEQDDGTWLEVPHWTRAELVSQFARVLPHRRERTGLDLDLFAAHEPEQTGPEPYIDPRTEAPMVLFGHVLVMIDRRSRSALSLSSRYRSGDRSPKPAQNPTSVSPAAK